MNRVENRSSLRFIIVASVLHLQRWEGFSPLSQVRVIYSDCSRSMLIVSHGVV